MDTKNGNQPQKTQSQQIVCIESNCLSGKNLTAEDEDLIRTAAEHLLAFIGSGVHS